MIYTVTFNPALDYTMVFERIKPGCVCRSRQEVLTVGGKGINVSLVLKELGLDSVALGFTAGFVGAAIENELNRLKIKSDFIRLGSGNSRINVKLKAGEETDLNARGPEIPKEAVGQLLEKLDALSSQDFLVLAGSVPESLPKDIYETVLSGLSDRKIPAAVDASGELLLKVLPFHPFLIKPNHHELGELFHTEIQTKREAAYYAQRLQEMGAQNVLVSLAGDGAVLLDEKGKCHQTEAAHGRVVNAVGAGDSMVAGFLAGFFETGEYEYALRLGAAAGSATAFSEGLAGREAIFDLAGQLFYGRPAGGEQPKSP